MSNIRVNKTSENIERQAGNVLFVEGNDDSIDLAIMPILFKNSAIIVEPLGPSYQIKSTAQALYKYHPLYYFLIDRDYHDDDYINDLWNDFPNPDKHNLLIWRKKEIENYFLDPEYLTKSEHLSVTKDKLESTILELCKERLYLDVANLVIISIREEFKENWIEIFTKKTDFKTKDDAIKQLKERPEFSVFKKKVLTAVNKRKIEKRFNDYFDNFTGSKDTLYYGNGKWLSLISGKKILPAVINDCFKIKDREGKSLQGNKKLEEITKDLVSKSSDDLQPKDFIQLRDKIINKIKTKINT